MESIRFEYVSNTVLQKSFSW